MAAVVADHHVPPRLEVVDDADRVGFLADAGVGGTHQQPLAEHLQQGLLEATDEQHPPEPFRRGERSAHPARTAAARLMRLTTASAASPPAFPTAPPARSQAWAAVSQVRIPNVHGTPVSSETWMRPCDAA